MFEDQNQECQVQFSGKIDQEDGGLLVREAGASMTLTFAGMPESETYLILKIWTMRGFVLLTAIRKKSGQNCLSMKKSDQRAGF